MGVALEASDIRVEYGELVAVDRASITVWEGSASALIGPNGAGKTSLLRALAGVLTPVSGVVSYFGEDVTRLPSHKTSKRGISMIPEGRLPFGSMSVLDNLLLPTYSMRLAKEEVKNQLAQVFELFPRLSERRKQKARHLSGGEQQMMVIARALMMRPKVLLIDEPSLGLAPIIVRQIYETIPKLLDSGLGILLVEQSVELVKETCGYVSVLREGLITYSGPTVDLNSADLARFYLQ